MKTKIFSLALAVLFISSTSFAKIWRINNNAGVNTNFTTAQAAVSSSLVLNGDTLYFEGSTSSYGNINILNKSLTLVGPGYSLNNWSSPVQANVFSARIATITNITASNVKLVGLEITGDVSLSASNFTMERCNMASTTFSFLTNANNVVLKQNILYILQETNNTGAVTNLLITNNLGIYGLQFDSGNDYGVIEFNTFGLFGNSYLELGQSFFAIKNNILIGSTNNSFTGFSNSSVEYNMAQQSNLLPANSNNQNGVNMNGSTVFVNNNWNTSQNDKNYMLSATSLALTAGAGGTPIGAYAGPTSYLPSGIPAIPTIYQLSLPSAITTGSTINVTFSSKSNN